MTRRVTSLFFLALASGGLASGATDLTRFEARRAIQLPALTGRETFVRVPVPVELFGAAAPGLSDVRVVDESGEVRYHLRVRRRETRRRNLSPRLLNRTETDSGGMRFELRLPEKTPPHNRVELTLHGEEFLYRALVEGRNDGDRWETLAKDGWVYRLGASGSSTERVTLRYPESAFSQLRITLQPSLEAGAGSSRAVSVAEARLYFEEETPGREKKIALALTREERPHDRKTVITMDLGQSGIPIHRIDWSVGGSNFKRHVEIAGASSPDTFVPLQSTTIHRFSVEGQIEEKTGFDVLGVYRFYRATIWNEDNPPIAIESAETSYYVREIVFSAEPGRHYNLYYRSAGLRPPTYDIASVVERLNLDALPEGRLDREESNPDFRAPSKPWSDRYPWILWAALGLTVALLGGLIVRALVNLGPGA